MSYSERLKKQIESGANSTTSSINVDITSNGNSSGGSYSSRLLQSIGSTPVVDSAPVETKTVALTNSMPTTPLRRETQEQWQAIEDANKSKNTFSLSTKNGKAIGEAQLNNWLDPNYQWSDGEKDEAKSVIANYRGLPFSQGAKNFQNLNDNDKAKATNILNELDARTKSGQSAMAFTKGLLKSLPGVNTLFNKAEESALNSGNAERAAQIERDQAFDDKHKVAEGVGNLVGKVAQYGAVKEIPAVGKVASGIGNKLGGSKLANAVGNIAADTLVDIGLDTIPEVVDNVSSGKSGKEIATDAAKNVAANVGFNVLGEAAPYVAKGIKDVATGATEIKALTDAVDNSKAIADAVADAEKDAVQVTKYTKIWSPYKGEVPVQKNYTRQRITIPEERLKDAKTNIDVSKIDNKLVGVSEKTILTKVYETLFGNGKTSFDVNVDGLKFKDSDYAVTVNKNAIGKIMSDKNLSAEKIAVIDELNNVIKNSEYVGSADFVNYKNKTNPKDVIRYDYFETDAKINGTDYVVTFDVEVIPGHNNYRTHKVIKEINLTQADDVSKNYTPKVHAPSGETASVADARGGVSGSSDLDIAKTISDVNLGTKETGGNLPPSNVNTEVGNAKHIGDKVSEVRANTLENSGINTKEELQNIYLDEKNFTYDSVTEKESLSNAIDNIFKDPQKAYNSAMEKTPEGATYQDVDTLFIFYRKLVDEARRTGDPELWKQASDTFKRLQEIGTAGGQSVQAFAKWSRNTKEGMLSEVFRKTKNTMKDKFGEAVADEVIDNISQNEMETINNLLSQVEGMDMNSREAKVILANIGKIVDKYTPKKITDQVKTILMDNMLGNFRTLVSRNAGGNVGYNIMEFLRQPITAGADKLLSVKTGKRTRTGWSADKITSSLNGLASGLREEADDLAKGIHTAKSGENTISNAIDLNKHVWSINHNTGSKGIDTFLNIAGKTANKLDDLVKHGLSVGDRPFYEAAYNQRMSELNNLYSRGLLGDEIQALNETQFKKIADLSARLDGLTATYQDSGAWASALVDIKRGISEASEGTVGVDILSQFSTPFVRTPGNIIERAIDYSPLGYIKTGAQALADKSRGGAFNQQRVADQLGRNTLGTLGLGGAVAAFNNGIVNGSYSEDPDVKAAQKRSGMIEYGVNIPQLNGNVDLSFMPVVGTLLTEGAAIGENIKNNPDASFGDNLVKGTGAMLNTLIDSSALQGLQRLVGGTNAYSTEGLAGNVKNTFESGLGQLIPSLARQVAQVGDEYERNISNGDRSYAINNLLSSIPYVRENELQPKIDNQGNYVLQNQGRGTASKIFEDMFLPGNFKEYQNNALDNEALRIFNSEDPDANGKRIQFVPNADRSDITTDTFTPTDEDFTNYQISLGKKKTELGETLINNPLYQNLDDVSKANVLQDIYSSAKASAKTDMLDDYTTNDKVANIYKNEGVDAAVDYLLTKTIIANEVGKNAKIGDRIPVLQKSNLSNAQKGLYLYNSENLGKGALQAYDQLGYEGVYDYYSIKNDSDLDKNGSLTNDEVANYLNSRTDMDPVKKAYWFSLIQSNAKKVPTFY